jgi:hypothetical protein
MRPLLLAAALAAAVPVAAPAAQADALSVEGLARASDLVVRGRVLRQAAAASPDGRRIHTLVELEVREAWRGAGVSLVRVAVPGGVVGALGQRVDGAPGFTEGEEVVLFLHRAEAGVHRVTGLAQGAFRVAGAGASPDLSHLTFRAAQVGPGERLAGPMSLAELQRRVRSVP